VRRSAARAGRVTMLPPMESETRNSEDRAWEPDRYAPPPVVPAARRPFPPSVNLACFLLTVVTTLIAGTLLTLDDLSPATVRDVFLTPSLWTLGLPYSASLILILGAHEMGHYVACRIYRIDASLPFFIPGPPILGTFGAVIRIRAPFTSRRALFDIGVAGPIAGFVVALPVLAIGLSRSTLLHQSAGRHGIVFTPCLLLSLALSRFFPGLAPGDAVQIHSVVVAAWVGLLATFLNLLPVGQLDGGHVLYALSARAHRLISRAGIVLLIAGGVLAHGVHLIVFGILCAIIGPRHPPVLGDTQSLGPGRILVALIALVIFILCVIPQSPGLS